MSDGDGEYQVLISSDAQYVFRYLKPHARIPLIRIFEKFRTNSAPEEDYGEVTQDGNLESVIIVGNFAVRFFKHAEDRVVQIIAIELAD